ncbi:MAG: ABC transporter ATP-binding protein, partial [Pseudobdellovibrionaceae bacterium]
MLEVKNLKTEFRMSEGSLLAVDDVSFSLQPGSTLGIVGESGCGKSITSLSLLRLVPSPGQIVGGEIFFQGQNLLELSEKDYRKIRGREIAMIFQEPMSSMNPVFTLGEQIEETIRSHFPDLSDKEIKDKSKHMLELVHFPSPDQSYNEFPHQFSGGMKQRAMIAMALSCNPKILIADEPTTALDVTIQAQILQLLKRLQKETKISLILITHDLDVVFEMCTDVLVMYAGKIIESGPVADIFQSPRHPYTRGLLDSRSFLRAIPGSVPSAQDWKKEACRFADRCERKKDLCL